jgi:hypothetical protein
MALELVSTYSFHCGSGVVAQNLRRGPDSLDLVGKMIKVDVITDNKE